MNEKKKINLIIWDNIAAILAVAISLISVYYSTSNYKDASTKQIIDNVSKDWHDVDKISISDWQLSHISALASSYDETKLNIHIALSPIDKKTKAKYIAQERAFATYLFDQFDNICDLYDEAKLAGNKKEIEYLETSLNYITNKELRNPRLLYLWDKNGGNLCSIYDPPTIEYYNATVLNNPKNPLIIEPDSIGPFYIDSL
jgi:hypothetical protein